MPKFIDQIIDAYEESKKLGGEELDFVKQLKTIQPGDAAEKLVSRLIHDSEKYTNEGYANYCVGMAMAYLEQCRQPEREWRCQMLKYAVASKDLSVMPQKIKDAFGLLA